MPKPSITKRSSKGSALTYTELDNNFQNLSDATVSLTAGTGGTAVTADLNGNITLVAGSNVTITGDNTAKTITIAATGGGGSGNSFTTIAVSGQSNVVADSSTDTLTLVAGTGISLTTNASTDTVTITNSANALAVNPSSGDYELAADLDLNGYIIRSNNTNIQVADDIAFPSGSGPLATANGILLCRGGTIKLEYTGDPGFELAGAITNATPSNTTTPNSWLKITVNGGIRFIPLYT